MEQFIGFLLKNWFLVIIALTIFYQIGSKRRRLKQGTPTKTRMPSFGDASGGAPRPFESRDPVQKGNGSTSQLRGVQDEYNRSTSVKTVSTLPKQKQSPFGSPAQMNTDSSPVYSEAISTHNPFPGQPNKEQLLQGVVWAEILGPPRSKKPYRR